MHVLSGYAMHGKLVAVRVLVQRNEARQEALDPNETELQNPDPKPEPLHETRTESCVRVGGLGFCTSALP